MDDQTRRSLEAYSRGEISASEAADCLGPGATAADVYVLSREAGLPLPDADGAFEQKQFEHAKKLFKPTDACSSARHD
jgi:hypothetical protein